MTEEYWHRGRIAYEAYAYRVGGVSVKGDALWSWDEMVSNNPIIAEAWNWAAECVVSEVFGG